MKHLADAILWEIGYRHCIRMNEARYSSTISELDFVTLLSDRLGVRDNVWARKTCESYLMQRLTPERLALPDGYDLRDRETYLKTRL